MNIQLAIPVHWQDAEPGDIFFTHSKAAFSRVIQFGTSSWANHTGMVVRCNEDGTWITNEALGAGFIAFNRDPKEMSTEMVVLRVADDPGEVQALLYASAQMLGWKYDWRNIARIAFNRVGWKMISKDVKNKTVCSEAMARALCEGLNICDPDLEPWETTPRDLLFFLLQDTPDTA